MTQTSIDRLIYLMSKIPGFGPRSARRAVLHMVKSRETLMLPLVNQLSEVADSVKICQKCCNIDVQNPCVICSDAGRDLSTICVVESVSDLWAMERGKVYRGNYHVLGGTLSAAENRKPEDLNIAQLLQRLDSHVQEIILATNATVDGQTTAYYLTEILTDKNIKISRIAYGIPVGGELDYIDEGTLNIALKTRQPF